jgi:hypothetical protein
MVLAGLLDESRLIFITYSSLDMDVVEIQLD